MWITGNDIIWREKNKKIKGFFRDTAGWAVCQQPVSGTADGLEQSQLCRQPHSLCHIPPPTRSQHLHTHTHTHTRTSWTHLSRPSLATFNAHRLRLEANPKTPSPDLLLRSRGRRRGRFSSCGGENEAAGCQSCAAQSHESLAALRSPRTVVSVRRCCGGAGCLHDERRTPCHSETAADVAASCGVSCEESLRSASCVCDRSTKGHCVRWGRGGKDYPPHHRKTFLKWTNLEWCVCIFFFLSIYFLKICAWFLAHRNEWKAWL